MSSTPINEEYIRVLNKLLEKDSKDYSATIDFLFATMDEIIDDYHFDKKDLEKGVAYIVGTTGAGKRTLLNYLTGKKLIVVQDDLWTIKLEL